jgi:hypothetical protein
MSTYRQRKRELLIRVAGSLIWHQWPDADQKAVIELADELLRQAKFGIGKVPRPPLPIEPP